MNSTTSRLSALALLIVFSATAAHAQEIWENPSLTFVKSSFADPNVEKDQITPNVALTRGDVAGLFNIAQEAAYDQGTFLAPTDTEWAYGAAADWASLTFQTWADWHGFNPPSSVGQPAVVHLISDDIYIDIEFLTWDVGAPFAGTPGGAFSYIRAEQPVAVPASTNRGLLYGAGLFAMMLALGAVSLLRR